MDAEDKPQVIFRQTETEDGPIFDTKPLNGNDLPVSFYARLLTKDEEAQIAVHELLQALNAQPGIDSRCTMEINSTLDELTMRFTGTPQQVAVAIATAGTYGWIVAKDAT